MRQRFGEDHWLRNTSNYRFGVGLGVVQAAGVITTVVVPITIPV